MPDDLGVGAYVIPERDLDWTFTTSGGPGGQHANRSNTRAEVRFDLGASEVFPRTVQERMLSATRHTNGIISVTVDESRSQFRNRQMARKRLAAMLEEAMIPPTPRRPTKPSRAARRRRLEAKRRQSEKKRFRQRPDQT